jgi:hypothetical protein
LVAFDRKLREAKRDFRRNVGSSLRRHRCFSGKGERSRLKPEKAIKRLNKKRFERA